MRGMNEILARLPDFIAPMRIRNLEVFSWKLPRQSNVSYLQRIIHTQVTAVRCQ